MKKVWVILFMFCMTPALFAAEQAKTERGTFASMGHLIGRGFANALLFPTEWGHLPKAEYGGALGIVPVALTHMGGRIFSGITDIAFLPVAYPFTHYDESIPENMGWGEFPWQKGSGV